jgi:biotin carboxyl carrier protein
VLARASGGFELLVEGRRAEADVVVLGDTLSLRIDGKMIDLTVEGQPPKVGVVASGRRVYLEVESERARAAQAARSRTATSGDDTVIAPMPGRVLKVLVARGDEVHAGQPVVVIEAMKMENELKATRAGVVDEILVAAGATVESGVKLLRLA